MEQKEDMNDELLGRWLAGELTDEERTSFEASDAFKTYEAIAQYAGELETPAYNTDEAYTAVSQKLTDKTANKGKVVRLSFYRKIAVAASFLIIIGLTGWYLLQDDEILKPTTVFTAQGETRSVVLPDNSQVELNVSSTISYSEDTWDEAREVTLDGEAFFEVTKGNRFAVMTDHGSIEVLGTSFNIRNRDAITEVVCYSGKVRVTDLTGNAVILTKEQATRITDGTLDQQWTPKVSEDAEWKNGSSSFHNVSLPIVIEELENQYGITIDCRSDISQREYVGAFPHDNLDQALQLVFDPMQLNFEQLNDSVIVIQ